MTPQLPLEMINKILFEFKGFQPYPFNEEFKFYVDLTNEEMNDEYLSDEERGIFTFNMLYNMKWDDWNYWNKEEKIELIDTIKTGTTKEDLIIFE